MKMNISFIADTLDESIGVRARVSRHRNPTLGHPMLYLTNMPFAEGGVYIAAGKDLPKKPKLPAECAIISIGGAPEPYQSGECDYIELDEDRDPAEVLNRIQACYDRYDTWNQELQDCIIEERSLQEMVEATLPLLVNPVYICDFRYNIVAYAEYENLVDRPRIYDDEANLLELINNFKLNEDWIESFQTKEAALWEDEVSPYNNLYCNLFAGDRYWGTVLVDERCRPFRESDYVILSILAHHVQIGLSKRDTLSDDSYRAIERHLRNILDGRTINRRELERDLESFLWNQYEDYFCILIKMETRDLAVNNMLLCCRLVEQQLIFCRAFPYSEFAVVLVPSEAWDGKIDRFCTKLAPILRDGLYKAAVSGVFHDLLDFERYYRQAIMAMEMGLKSDSTKWIYSYEDFLLDYMLDESCGNLSAELLCHPKLIKLLDYDRENHLEFVKTLQGYLENNCRQAQTCRALYLHRSTLLQRLGRIQELTGFDLEDPDTQLYLRMILRLLEF